jgi:putative aldouronate transport system substrate-binding protein
MRRFLRAMVSLTLCLMLLASYSFGALAAVEYVPSTEKGLTPYDEEVTITTWRIMSSGFQFADGESIDDNVWYRAYKDRLNINVQNVWSATNTGSGSAADQKRSVSIASGELPDIMELTSVQFAQLANAGLLADLTDLYDEYVSADVKEKCYNQDLTDAILSTTIDGRIYGIAYTNPVEQTFQQCWIRTDWLENLGLEEPETYEDLLAVAEAFAKNDPDGNGMDDTYGFPMNKELFDTNFVDMNGFMQQFHAYPQVWVRDADNNMVFGNVQPEMKTALAELQRLMKEGLVDKEFGVKSVSDAVGDVAAGRCGIVYGVWWISQAGWLQESINNDPNADWKPFRLFPTDDEPIVYYGATPVSAPLYYAVSKDSKNPEALFKLANAYVDWRFGALNGDPDTFYYHDGIDTSQYAVVKVMPVRKNIDIILGLKEYAETGDLSVVNTEGKTYLEQIESFRNGDRKFWYRERSFGEYASQDINTEILNNNEYMRYQYYGTPTEAQTKYSEILKQLTQETFTAIINGQDINSFDDYVASWYAMGGQKWTDEVRAWDALQPK